MLYTFLQVVHVFVCSVLMFVVLLQQGKGGGMGAALGGGGAAQVFGGRGAGNILTRATAIAAMTFMLTSVALAYKSSEGDRALRARATAEDQKHGPKPSSKAKEDKPVMGASTPTPGSTPAEPAPVPPPAPSP